MMGARDEDYNPLFENRRAKGLILYRIFAASLLVSILTVLIYRSTHLPYFEDDDENEDGGWKKTARSLGWMGILAAEMWFALYWIFSQALRWNPVYRCTFKHNLLQRYGDELPGVDVFVCTADPAIEPPLMVVNTVLSVMAYDYPPEKLSVYLSDDGGSDLTFYAMWEASAFARQWLPYCRRYKVEPRSPAAFFNCHSILDVDPSDRAAFISIKKVYEEMAKRIEESTELGKVPEEAISQHKGFSQWDCYISKHDHPTILQILVDGKRSDSGDCEGINMPNLVYMAREKRPQHLHNFKAGAMNALIRVSSKISNGAIILNVDCDMYANDSKSILDALCFFMDEKQSQQLAYVQFPQMFDNITDNDLYGSSLRVIKEVDFHGQDGNGGPLYVGSNCFHLREVLCGRNYDPNIISPIQQWKTTQNGYMIKDVVELELNTKALASCTYEINTQWGKQMGLKYGCPVEDVITGLSIQCRGWKSAYYNPTRPGFLGVAPTSLTDVLVQHKRWSEGDFQILVSKYCPLWFGHGRISPLLQLGYLYYCCWACNCFATIFYSLLPSLFLINRISLFPEVSSPWFIPFAYIIIGSYTYSLVEFLQAQGTTLGWWNEQRIWLYKRVTSYLFAFVDSILKMAGFADLKFVITSKVADEDVMKRYMEEKIEFGVSSPMFTILATLALLNLFSLVTTVVKSSFTNAQEVANKLGLQVLICGSLVALNFPLYDALFLRKDKGKMPNSITVRAIILAFSICASFSILV